MSERSGPDDTPVTDYREPETGPSADLPADEPQAVDLAALAGKIVALLRRDLQLERERLGRRGRR